MKKYFIKLIPSKFSFSEYNLVLSMLKCQKEISAQVLTLKPIPASLPASLSHGHGHDQDFAKNDNHNRMFEIIGQNGKCLIPQEHIQDGQLIRTVKSSDSCPGFWIWTPEGQMQWFGQVPWHQGEHLVSVRNQYYSFQKKLVVASMRPQVVQPALQTQIQVEQLKSDRF